MKISFESDYYIGDEVLYETTALKNGSFVQVFMLSKIKTISISCPNNNGHLSVKYELEDGKVLEPSDVRGHMKSSGVRSY